MQTLWNVLTITTVTTMSTLIVWASSMIYTIKTHKLKLDLIVLLCVLQILSCMSFAAHNVLGHYLNKTFSAITFQFIMLYTSIVGVKNWIFTMKNWKLSLTLT